MNSELREIKKIYGEEMMHLCRELFASLLEKEGFLLQLLKKNLASSHSFAKDIKENGLENEFRNWLYSSINRKEKKLIEVDKTPFELMKEAGYTLKECLTESDIESYKKYYEKNEELCTFNGGRLNRCYVFFAVKDNVNEIKREDFPNPEREDEYGTSVISIQFSRERPNYLSIKNRYNHTVDNPDATFSNNLENIIHGLTRSFEKKYNFNITESSSEEEKFLTRRLNYTKAKDGKYYRYNTEQNAIYYCENDMIIKDGLVVNINDYLEKKENEPCLLIEDNVIDFKNKTINCLSGSNSSFIESIKSVGVIKNFEIRKMNNNRVIIIKYEDNKEVEIEINRSNAIVGYKNHYIKTIDDNFLSYSKEIEYIDIPNVRTIKDGFLERTEKLKSISLPNVTKIGNNFLTNNKTVTSVYLPKVESIGEFFMDSNLELESISLPKVTSIGKSFLSFNEKITEVSFPELLTIGSCFFYHNVSINHLDLPKVKIIGSQFMPYCKGLKKIYLPEVVKIGNGFCSEYNDSIEEVNLPKVEEIGSDFIHRAGKIRKVYLPKARIIGENFLYNSYCLEELSLPEALELGEFFMASCYHLKRLSIPKVKKLLDGSLQECWDLEHLYCPSLEEIGKSVLYQNVSMREIDLSNVKRIYSGLLYKNKKLREMLAPNLVELMGTQSDLVKSILNKNNIKIKRL